MHAKRPFPKTELDAVAGLLSFSGPAKTLEEMEEAFALGVAEQHGER